MKKPVARWKLAAALVISLLNLLGAPMTGAEILWGENVESEAIFFLFQIGAGTWLWVEFWAGLDERRAYFAKMKERDEQ